MEYSRWRAERRERHLARPFSVSDVAAAVVEVVLEVEAVPVLEAVMTKKERQ